MFFELVTPCIRPQNLSAIAASIPVPSGHFRWWIVLDGVDLPAGLEQQLPVEAVVLQHTDPASVSGNAQRNHALDAMGNRAGHWVYFLDDDTLMHPDWWSVISAGAPADMISFGLQRTNGTTYTSGFASRRGTTDTGNHLFHRPFIGDRRWSLSAYGADGEFIEGMAEQKGLRRIINRGLGLYNAIQPDAQWPEPSLLRDVFRHHTGPVSVAIEPINDPAELLANQLGGALFADDTGAELFFFSVPQWSAQIPAHQQAPEHRWAMGFRNASFRTMPPADNAMDTSVLQRPDLFARLVTWLANNPSASVAIAGGDFLHVLSLYEQTPAWSQLAAELRAGWQLFRLDEPQAAASVVVDATAWTASIDQTQHLQSLTATPKHWIWCALTSTVPPPDIGVAWDIRGPGADYWATWQQMVIAETFVTWGGAMGIVAKLLRNDENQE